MNSYDTKNPNQEQILGKANHEIAEVSHGSATAKTDSCEGFDASFELLDEPKTSYKQLFSLQFITKSNRNLQVVTRDYTPEMMVVEVYKRNLGEVFSTSRSNFECGFKVPVRILLELDLPDVNG